MRAAGSFKFRNAYAGGYSDEIKRQLENIRIPDKVKCASCNLVKMQAGYSQRQLEDLRHAIYSHNIDAIAHPVIRCRVCTGGQVVEIKCCVCDVVKSVDEFARAQRHDRDRARCLVCVQQHSDAEAVIDEQKFLADTEHSSLHEPTLSASHLYEGSNTESLRHYADSDGDDGGVSVSNGGWVENEKENVDRSRGHTGSGGPGELRARSVHSGWGSFGLISPKSVVPRSPPKKESRWPKIPARVRSENAPLRPPSPAPVTSITPDDDDEDEAGVEDFL